MRQIFIFCDGGLATRIASLVSGLAIAELLGLGPLVLWPVNNRCSAAFEEIFQPDPLALPVRLQDLVPYQDRVCTWLHENDLGFPGPNTPARTLSGIDDLYALAARDDRTILFSDNSFLPWLPPPLVAQVLNRLAFRPFILSRARRILAEHANRPYFGIHLRGTNFPVAAPTEKMLTVVTANPGHRFFVCSDEADLERRFASFPNVFLHHKSAYVEKMAPGPWRGDVKDSDGRPYTSNIVRSAQSVAEACVDLVLLAASTPIETSPSSFLALAQRLKGCGYPKEHLFGRAGTPSAPPPAAETLLRRDAAKGHETYNLHQATGGTRSKMKITLVNYEAALGIKDGILTKYAEKMEEGLRPLGVEVTVESAPNPAADVNHHINYLAYKPVLGTRNTLMVTHFTQGTESKLGFLRKCMESADVGIAMSPAMAQYLTLQGIERQTYVLPAHDGFKRRKQTIAILTKTYPDGRKREWMVPELVKTIDKEKFAFKIMGDGWQGIVGDLKARGMEGIEYYDYFDMDTYVEILNTSDFILYTGDEDCLAQSLIDATQVGVKTIAKAQPDIPIDYPFNTQEELDEIFRKLSYNPVEDWTWATYSKKHLEIWEKLFPA